MLSGESEVGGVELKEDATLEEASASVGGVADRKLASEDNNDIGSGPAAAMMSAILFDWLETIGVVGCYEVEGSGRIS